MSSMKVFYRISDGSHDKRKPEYLTKQKTFLHFLSVFKKYDIYVFADNVKRETYTFLCQYLPHYKIIETKLGNSKSFVYALDFALKFFPDETAVYFAEDDYIYTQSAPKIIEEGLQIGDYSSGYDHPDKYMNHCDGGPNPFIEDGGEKTVVLLTGSSHWKITNSFCMTFASTVKTLKADRHIIERHCQGPFPYDFPMYTVLRNQKNRKLVSCIPSVCTHGELLWLAKLVDWEKEFHSSLVNSEKTC